MQVGQFNYSQKNKTLLLEALEWSVNITEHSEPYIEERHRINERGVYTLTLHRNETVYTWQFGRKHGKRMYSYDERQDGTLYVDAANELKLIDYIDINRVCSPEILYYVASQYEAPTHGFSDGAALEQLFYSTDSEDARCKILNRAIQATALEGRNVITSLDIQRCAEALSIEGEAI